MEVCRSKTFVPGNLYFLGTICLLEWFRLLVMLRLIVTIRLLVTLCLLGAIRLHGTIRFLVLMDAVARKPVAVAIETDQMELQLRRHGGFSKECGEKLNHDVLVVGYSTEDVTDYWKVKNSRAPVSISFRVKFCLPLTIRFLVTLHLLGTTCFQVQLCLLQTTRFLVTP